MPERKNVKNNAMKEGMHNGRNSSIYQCEVSTPCIQGGMNKGKQVQSNMRENVKIHETRWERTKHCMIQRRRI